MIWIALFLYSYQVFLTWRAVYIVTFDLSKDLDEKIGDTGSAAAKVRVQVICQFIHDSESLADKM